jgi:CubicO group peptidase (beta-lactamase class C family)
LAGAGLLLAAASRLAAAAPRDPAWAPLDRAAQEAVAAGKLPGVVFLVSQRGKTVYRKAFGSRAVRPETVPMTVDTLFDLASLTKVIATTSSIMALVEDGAVELDAPAARYWPEFGRNGKQRVTIRQLLTHSSGLPAWADFNRHFGDPNGAAVQDHSPQVMNAIAEMALSYPTDTRQVYSDLGFITLGEVVRRVSGEPLDEFAHRRIFRPLRMRHTTFNPSARLRKWAAPTTERNGVFLQGEVHDPNAAVTGGVAGHAGLFSTADDLARFAAMLLSGDGHSRRHFPLRPATVRLMTRVQTPPGLPLRGLGWDIASPYAHVRGKRMPPESFGHTGFTGTFLWIDPSHRTFLIGLSNRVHPDGKGNPLALWARASDIVAEAAAGAHEAPR